LLRACLKAFASNRDGGFATMAGVFMPIALMLSALAIDRGALFVEKQNLQSLADLAAITAAGNLTNATNAAVLVIKDNETQDVTVSSAGSTYDPLSQPTRRVNVVLERGRYTGRSDITVGNRFQPGVTPFNAVRVKLRKGGDLYFAKLFMPTPVIETSAVATFPAQAAFSIGSRLAALDGGVLNAVLGELIGAELSLSVMDYQALLTADISAFDLMSAMATNLNLQAGTYNDVLNSSVTVAQLASAMAAIPGINQTASLALTSIANAPVNAPPIAIPLRRVIDLGDTGRLGIGEKPQGLDATLSMMDLLSGAAAVASGGKQVSVNLAGSIPGLTKLTLDVAVGEPPQHSPFYAVGEAGTIVRTAQTRIKLTTEILGPGALSGLGGLATAGIKLPVYVEVAYAEARLSGISCATGRPESLNVSIAARPGIADLYLGNVDTTQFQNFSVRPTPTPAALTDLSLKILGLTVPVLRVNGSAHASVTNVGETTLTFNKAEIDARAIKTVSTSDIAQTLTQTLVNNLHLTVQTLVFGTNVPAGLKSAITAVLNPVTPALDKVLYNTLATLGIRLGEADIRIHGATCGRSVLVQ
jgi:uncharacterized membrane protein